MDFYKPIFLILNFKNCLKNLNCWNTEWILVLSYEEQNDGEIGLLATRFNQTPGRSFWIKMHFSGRLWGHFLHTFMILLPSTDILERFWRTVSVDPVAPSDAPRKGGPAIWAVNRTWHHQISRWRTGGWGCGCLVTVTKPSHPIHTNQSAEKSLPSPPFCHQHIWTEWWRNKSSTNTGVGVKNEKKL